MSTVVVATVKSNSSSPPTFQNTSGTEIGRLCRAFVNFDGSTGTIRASYNVSSITKDATGKYQINFTTAMPDANYSVNVTCNKYDSNDDNNVVCGIRSSSTSPLQTGLVKVTTGGTANNQDCPFICVSIFR